MAPVQRKAAHSVEGWQIFCRFSKKKTYKSAVRCDFAGCERDINITITDNWHSSLPRSLL
jgi:hypothetical protein